MDPTAIPGLLAVTVPQQTPAAADATQNAAAFQAIFRENLERAPAVKGVDIGRDVREAAQNFITMERRSTAERFNLMQGFMPRTGAAEPGVGLPGRGATGDHGASSAFGPGARGVIGMPQPIFSDASKDAPPIMQSALGISPDTPATEIDFTSELRNLTAKIDGVFATMKQKMAQPMPNTVEASTRMNSEIQALTRLGDDLVTQRSMLGTLQIAAFQENKSRYMVVYEHITGSIKKVNEIFNSLKQGS